MDWEMVKEEWVAAKNVKVHIEGTAYFSDGQPATAGKVISLSKGEKLRGVNFKLKVVEED